MSTVADIAIVYARECASPIAVPVWAQLPLCTTGEGGRKADGWSVRVVTPTHVGPERRAVVREPVLCAHGARVLPRQAGWLFAAGRA